jgi:hypothetical protein
MTQRKRTRRQNHRVSPLPIALLLVLTNTPRARAQTQTTEAPLPTFSQTSGSTAAVPAPDAPGAVVPVPEKTAAPATPLGAKPATAAAPINAAPATIPDAGTPSPKPRKCNWEWVRDGFYMRLLNAVGFANFSGTGPSGSTHISGLGTGSILALGGSFKRGLVLAGTLQSTEVAARFNGGPYADATFVSNGEAVTVSQKATATFSQLGVLLDWYPMTSEGLHVGVGAGLGFVSVVTQADNSTMSGASLAGTLLVGYDWPVAPTWAFGLALVASAARTASLKYQGSQHTESGNDSGYKLMPYSIGLSGSLLFY